MLLFVNFTEHPSIISCKWDTDLVPGMGRTCVSTLRSQAIARPDALHPRSAAYSRNFSVALILFERFSLPKMIFLSRVRDGKEKRVREGKERRKGQKRTQDRRGRTNGEEAEKRSKRERGQRRSPRKNTLAEPKQRESARAIR